MSNTPTQIEIEQAPAKKLLAEIRARKLAESFAAVDRLWAGYPWLFRAARRRAARFVLAEIIAGRIPNITFNG